MKKLKKYFKGFTLVELIIVITILAILATIAFVSFQDYIKDARDSNRITSLKNIESGLQAFQISTGNYPESENYTLIQASGTTISYQGYIGDIISKQIKINKTPTDPFDQTKYIYSTNTQKTKYQLLSYFENQNQVSYTTLTFATDYNTRLPKVIGDSIGILVDTSNTPVSGTSIDILKTNSGTLYKSYFGENDNYIGSGNILFSNIYTRRSDLIENNKNLANLDESLMGYWDMQTTIQSGSLLLLKDLSKYENHGICYNDSTSSGSCGVTGASFNNGGMKFDGINDYVEINKNIYSNDMTIVIQIEPTLSDSFYHGFVGYQDPVDARRSMNLWITPRTNNNGGLHYWTNEVTSTGMYNKYFAGHIYNYYDPNIGFTNKFNIGYKRENGKLVIISNGNKLLDQATGYSDFYKPNTFWIGRVDNYFGGNIYSVRVYNRALSENEILNYK